MKKIALFALGVVSMALTAPASVYYQTDFSSYSDGDLAGQNGWAQVLASATNPIQVSDGKVVLPGATTDAQDVGVPVSIAVEAGTSVVYGLEFQMLGPGAVSIGATSSYVTAMNMGGFANLRLAVQNIDGVNYALVARLNGQGPNPFMQIGPTFQFGSDTHTVFLSYEFGAPDVMTAWVAPLSADADPNMTQFNAGSAGGAADRFLFSQFQGGATMSTSQVVVASSFSEAYTAIPEPTTGLLLGTAGLLLFGLRRQRHAKK